MTRKFYKSFESFEQNQVAEDMDEMLDSEVVYVTDSAFIKYLKNKTIRGFHGHSLYNVGKYFFRGIFMEHIQMRASSLSFNFFHLILCQPRSPPALTKIRKRCED